MKRISIILSSAIVLMSFHSLSAQLIKLSETDTVFQAPESVAWDSVRNCLYVSNYTAPLKEGSFYGLHTVSKVSMTGEILEVGFVTGLSCPTGICIRNDKLYIVERFGIVEFDLDFNYVSNKFYIKTTEFINDITIDNQGNIYVTTSGSNILFKITEGKVEHWIEDESINDANGILFDGEKLIIGIISDGYLKEIDPDTKELRNLAFLGEGIIDGIKKCSDGYLVSLFKGNLYHISFSGEVKELLNTRSESTFLADFEYISSKNLIVIPTLWNNKLVFFEYNGN